MSPGHMQRTEAFALMNRSMHVTDTFIQDLARHGDAIRAERAKRYHKSSREHWGLPTPQLDAVVKQYVRQYSVSVLLQLSQDLWQTQVFDLMMAGGRILGQKQIPATEGV
ncbi:hypothetical protein C2W62_39410 [Candidatus Entotheonella serta]|nr:hypothetical protein C2W62_39410 [Candidatus Entotheonella serta]